MRRHYILLPLAALLAMLPLLRHGLSCGHDIPFHLQSWLDAAAQMRHGTLYPQWAYTPAWQAGEPRFIFYPPLSWMFGALLTLILPVNAAPMVFIYAVLTGAAFSMYALARRFASPPAALLAACAYLGNPYMFFNAWERSAYAELLAAVWIPLVFLAILRARPSILLAALSLALAWLSNVPSGIMATYTFAVLALLRLAIDAQFARRGLATHHVDDAGLRRALMRGRLRDTAALAGGLLFGLLLPAFYLLPAAIERHWVQAAMAIIPNLRPEDNFLFARTSYQPHNVVTHTVSVLAVWMLAATAAVLLTLFTAARPRRGETDARRNSIALALLFLLVLFLLLPASALVWRFAPELSFLQFPWRLLTILAPVVALALALTVRRWDTHSTAASVLASAVGFALIAVVSGIASPVYRQACDITPYPAYTRDLFRSGHGVIPTDEYTPGDADNDMLRPDNPGFWLAPPDNPSAYAPNTVANPNETDPDFDGPIPVLYTVATHAPTHLDLQLNAPAVLVLNLRDFPDWHITVNGKPAPPHIRRDDGLVAFALPAGPAHVDIRWHRGADIYAGDALSLAGLLGLAFTHRRSRKIGH